MLEIEPKAEIKPDEMVEQGQEQGEIKPEWHPPVVTRIDIKKTLFFGTSMDDGDGFGERQTFH